MFVSAEIHAKVDAKVSSMKLYHYRSSSVFPLTFIDFLLNVLFHYKRTIEVLMRLMLPFPKFRRTDLVRSVTKNNKWYENEESARRHRMLTDFLIVCCVAFPEQRRTLP